MATKVEHPWSTRAEDVLRELGSDTDGLSSDEVERRLDEYGPNRLREAERRSAWSILWAQLASVVLLLLVAAGLVAMVLGDWLEAAAIAGVVVLNTAIGFVTEWRAVRALESLQKFSEIEACVVRRGEPQRVSAEDLVPGDTVIIEEGDLVPADIRVLESGQLQVDESPLTGESTPVDKGPEPVDEEATLADRASSLFKGTRVVRGHGRGVVVATGMATEVGEISALVQEAEGKQTPLEERLDELGKTLVWLTLLVAAFVAVSGGLAGRDWAMMVKTAVALAVAAVPEGLAIVATVALASGMRRMASHNALIRRLSSVETLGSVEVIFTDKTGTITTGEMTVRELSAPRAGRRDADEVDPKDDAYGPLLRVAILANTARLDSKEGDPTELAILRLGRELDLSRETLLEEQPEICAIEFTRETEMMCTFHETDDGGVLAAMKGSPEAVIEACTDLGGCEAAELEELYQEMAREGLRVIGIASRRLDAPIENPFSDATFLGFVGLIDPPRSDVAGAIAAARRAGIEVLMVTGDHPETARSIALETNVVDDGDDDVKILTGKEFPDDDSADSDGEKIRTADSFARVTPKQKLEIINAYQEAGKVVAMTGDGVNDAPALKKADIGIAMGKRGTEVAKEASDMVLLDDLFSTILVAIQQGRNIFLNIRKFVIYLLSGNVGEIIAVAAASIVGAPLPLLPLQILYLNMINDVFPALALGVGKGSDDVMKRPPRDPDESVITAYHWGEIVGYGIVIAATTLGVFAYALTVLEFDQTRAVTVSFLGLSVARLLHVFNMREHDSSAFNNRITRNPFVWGAIALSVGLLCFAVYVGPLAGILDVTDPGIAGWGLVAVAGVAPLVVGQIYLFVRNWLSTSSE